MCRRGNTECFEIALNELKNFDALNKKIIEQRYIQLLVEFQRRCWFYAFLFHSTRFLMTVGSLIVPALLSIQYTDSRPIASVDSEDFSYMIYWTTWVISLLVTTSNGISTLFKIEKKYYFLHATLEQLRSEGWQFLELSGKYSGFYAAGDKVTHNNQFLYFCHWVEKLKMKQVQEEYQKVSDSSHINGSNQPSSTASKSGEGHTESDAQSAPQEKLQDLLPNFLLDSLLPPTPYNIRLQHFLQKMGLQEKPSNAVVDGGKVQKGAATGPSAAAGPTNATAGKKTEMPMRSEVSSESPSKESVLPATSAQVSKEESIIRVGAEIPAATMEQKSEYPKNP